MYTINMIAGQNAIFQTFLGTLFTWGLTALGAALVFIFNSKQVCTIICFTGI